MAPRAAATAVVVPIYLIVACSVALSSARAAPQSSHVGDNKKSSNDFDELRISSNQFSVGRSSNIPIVSSSDGHSRSAGGSGGDGYGSEQRITNHIGKPLIPLPVYSGSKLSHPSPPQTQHQQQPSSLPHLRASNSSLPGGGGGSSSSSSVNGRSGWTNKAKPDGNVCRWMSLREFKNISLDTSELILRDHTDRAYYILTMKAFIKYSDDDYFPLTNMKALPYIDHIPALELPYDGAAAHDPSNCSYVAASMANRLAGIPLSDEERRGDTRVYLIRGDPIRFFEEHIKILVDCGYLILHIQGDGYNLILKSLSFYQNPGGTRQQVPTSSYYDPWEKDQAENLVFTTKDSKNVPLFTMPQTSRYICKKGIILTGNGSKQLVLQRFELQRLMGKLVDPAPPQIPFSPLEVNTESEPNWLPLGGINRYKRFVAFYDMPLCPLNTSVTMGRGRRD